MLDLESLTTLLGWCSVVNAAVLALTTVSIIALKGFISDIHGRMFGIQKDALPEMYFQYLANYKIAIIVFNVAPYIALRLMAL